MEHRAHDGDDLPVIVAVVSAVFHVMLNYVGMRTRRPCAALIVGIAASVIVIALTPVDAWPMTKTWFAADAMVGATIWIVRPSRAAVPPPAPETTSSRLSTAEGAVKLEYPSPETTSWSAPAKSLVTLRTSVLPASS